MNYVNNAFRLIYFSLFAVMNCSLFFSYSLLAQEGKIIILEGPSGAGCSTIAKMLRNKIPHAVLMDNETMMLWLVNKIFAQFNLPNQDSLESFYNFSQGLNEPIVKELCKVTNSLIDNQVYAEYFSIIRSFVTRGLTVIIENYENRDYFNSRTLGIGKKRILLYASLPVLVQRIRCFLDVPSSFEKITRLFFLHLFLIKVFLFLQSFRGHQKKLFLVG